MILITEVFTMKEITMKIKNLMIGLLVLGGLAFAPACATSRTEQAQYVKTLTTKISTIIDDIGHRTKLLFDKNHKEKVVYHIKHDKKILNEIWNDVIVPHQKQIRAYATDAQSKMYYQALVIVNHILNTLYEEMTKLNNVISDKKNWKNKKGKITGKSLAQAIEKQINKSVKKYANLNDLLIQLENKLLDLKFNDTAELISEIIAQLSDAKSIFTQSSSGNEAAIAKAVVILGKKMR